MQSFADLIVLFLYVQKSQLISLLLLFLIEKDRVHIQECILTLPAVGLFFLIQLLNFTDQMGYAILFLEVELDRRLALQNVEHFEDGLVHFFNPILQNNDHNLVRVNALLVQVDNILPDALKSVVEHGAIFIIHADTDGHFDVAVGFHLAEEVVGVLGADVVEVRVLGRLIVFEHDLL